jgi:hypothetical protein
MQDLVCGLWDYAKIWCVVCGTMPISGVWFVGLCQYLEESELVLKNMMEHAWMVVFFPCFHDK